MASPSDEAVLAYLVEHGPATFFELAAALSFRLSTVAEAVHRLTEAGDIEEVTDGVRLMVRVRTDDRD